MGGCSFPRENLSFEFAWLPWAQPEPTPTPQPISLLIGAGNSESNAALLSALQQFGAQHGGVTYNVTFAADYEQALQTAIASGALPDIFVVAGHRLPDLAQQGLLAPVPVQHHHLATDLYPGMRSALTAQGNLVCLPRSVTSLALVYNAGLFEARGVAPPSASWTWEDLRAAAEQLTNPNDDLHGLVIDADMSRLLAFYRQAGGEASIPLTVSKLTGEPARAAVAFLVGLFAEGFAAQSVDTHSVWAGDALGRVGAAMIVEGGWVVPYLEQNFPELRFGVVPLPRGPVGGGTTAFVTCYAVSASAARQIEAFETVAFLAQPDSTAAVAAPDGYAPPYLGMAGAWIGQFPSQAPFVMGLDDALIWQPDVEQLSEVNSANEALRSAFDGDLDIDGVLESLSSDMPTTAPTTDSGEEP